jgi:hypothetical protein
VSNLWVITCAAADGHLSYWSEGGFSLGGGTCRQLGTPDALTGTVCTFADRAGAMAAFRAKFGRLPRTHRAVLLTSAEAALLTGPTEDTAEAKIAAQEGTEGVTPESVEPCVPAVTGELTAEIVPADMTEAEACEVTEQIRGHLEATWRLIVDAFTRRAWVALGYASWDTYCIGEFDGSRLRLPREDRIEMVRSLRHEGLLSNRTIASALGVSEGTVRNDLAAGAQNYAPDSGAAMVNAEAEVVDTEILPDAEAEVIVWPSETILERRRSDREKIDAWKRAGEEPATVIGLDHKNYPAKQKPRPIMPRRAQPRTVARRFLEQLSVDLHSYCRDIDETSDLFIDPADIDADAPEGARHHPRLPRGAPAILSDLREAR